MNKAEQETIRNIIKRLGPTSDDLDPRLIPHREALRLYLDTWILAPLELLAKEGRTRYDLQDALRMSR